MLFDNNPPSFDIISDIHKPTHNYINAPLIIHSHSWSKPSQKLWCFFAFDNCLFLTKYKEIYLNFLPNYSLKARFLIMKKKQRFVGFPPLTPEDRNRLERSFTLGYILYITHCKLYICSRKLIFRGRNYAS